MGCGASQPSSPVGVKEDRPSAYVVDGPLQKPHDEREFRAPQPTSSDDTHSEGTAVAEEEEQEDAPGGGGADDSLDARAAAAASALAALDGGLLCDTSALAPGSGDSLTENKQPSHRGRRHSQRRAASIGEEALKEAQRATMEAAMALSDEAPEVGSGAA